VNGVLKTSCSPERDDMTRGAVAQKTVNHSRSYFAWKTGVVGLIGNHGEKTTDWQGRKVGGRPEKGSNQASRSSEEERVEGKKSRKAGMRCSFAQLFEFEILARTPGSRAKAGNERHAKRFERPPKVPESHALHRGLASRLRQS
jgi:hypothetical protein